ncbi:hypothetical protein [Marinomonas atlantica]|uniref:hypothetical protein n=1 Tax=Marinomonas atlantica TaxID=1806668 RepID=UPI00083083DE|nr:hypothetical protein [Marinomonas atlantica]
MNRLESLLSILCSISIEDIAQAPREEQHLLVDNIEDLQDRLNAILQATDQPLFPIMLLPSPPSTIH